MIKQLQKLKSKRGFTILELIVVVAILGVLLAVVIGNSNNMHDKINAANAYASDFYSTVQSEFTNLQNFDGPLTATLAESYSFKAGSTPLSDKKVGGVKYYPAVGGNYPYNITLPPADAKTQLEDLPVDTTLFLEVRVYGGQIQYVDFDNEWTVLVSNTSVSEPTPKREIATVLKKDFANRMDFTDGFYYAKITYTAPTTTPGATPSINDYNASPVKVEWTAYSKNQITNDVNTYSFKTRGIVKSGVICGVCPSADSSVSGLTGETLG